tara:strand:+ start:165 stop:1136 length:972 start_codon:yes stop_codon:yes gene_type:complete
MKNKLLKKFKIYVAGHNGMVGRAVISYLKHEGVKKLIFENRKKLNLLNSKDLEIFIRSQKPDIIINCAGKVGGILANASYPVEFINENIFIQLNLINLAYKYKIKHFINLGSSCIYPKNSKQPIKEQYLLSNELEKTNEAYALAKIVGLKVCEFYNQQYKTNFFTLMPCNLYGPFDNFHSKNSHFIPALIKKFIQAKRKKNNEVEIWGSGLARREVMHVDDLANAIGYLLKLKINNNKKLLKIIKINSLINVGSGQEFQIKKFAEIINKLTLSNKKLRFNRRFPDGTKRKILDISFIKKLGWKSKINLTDGLKDTIEWYKSNY